VAILITMPSSPPDQFYKWELETPENIFLRQPIDGRWRSYSYQQAGNEIRRIAAGLKSLNLPAQSNIAILSKNCAHWIMADLAIWLAGHVCVPIYPTLSSTAVRFLLEHSESKVIFLGKLDEYERQRPGIPESVLKISFPIYGPGEGKSWEELMRHEPLMANYSPPPDSLATIIYSSGTTGTPKGVMLSFGALDFFGKAIIRNFEMDRPYPFFSYLPLSHIAERAYVEMGVLYSGSNISFAESLDKFGHNLGEVQPVLFGGVPRIFAKFQEGVLSKLSQKRLDLLLSLPAIRGIIKKYIQKKIGLSKAKAIVCGAAPIPVSLLEWYQKIGISIHEVYGLTEDCGYSHGDHGGQFKYGTVGKAWPGVMSKLGDGEEILVRHGAMMTGYFKDPETTKSVFTEDGFLKTGDTGSVDKEGFLTITGRIKDQFKTDKAKFIAPAAMEMKLLDNPDIDQVCVVGIGIPQPIALIVLSAIGKTKSKPSLTDSLTISIQKLNGTLEDHEKLTAAVIMKGDWTIENGLMTPTLKVKRNEVEKIHSPNYTKWYGKREWVVWE
jgi:long-chain acyl-CoA synthetase